MSQNAAVMPERNNLGGQHRPQQVFTRLVFDANDRERVTAGRFLTQQKRLDDTNLAQFSANLPYGGFKFRPRVSRFLVNKGTRVKSTGSVVRRMRDFLEHATNKALSQM